MIKRLKRRHVGILVGALAVLIAELSAWGWLERNEQLRLQQIKLDAENRRTVVTPEMVKPEPKGSAFRLLVG